MPSLFVIQGRDQGKRFELGDPRLTLGRDPSSQIQLHDTEVSRRHAELRMDDDTVEVVDLDSSNGTFLNGQRVSKNVLSSGDRLQLGRTLMIFTAAPPAPSAAVDQVDIIGLGPGGSQIVHSVPQEEAGRILDPNDSKWLDGANRHLQVIYRTALAVSHTMDIDQLLDRIMGLIFEWVEADRGCVMLVNRDSGELEVKARRDRHRGREDSRMVISRTILDYVLRQQEGVLTSDAREDRRFDAAGSIISTGVCEAICVPMQGRYGNVGLIYIDTFTPPGRTFQPHRVNRFGEEHLKLMVAIGHQAALAIEDTSYYSAMVQAERLAAIGQTIAGLSHHVKNILQGIRGGSYLIEEGLKDNDPDVTLRGWRIVEKNQERISSLVMDMLTFSKDRQPDMVESNLDQILTDIIELMRLRAEEAGVRIVDARSVLIPPMIFDGEGLHRAILNVVTNAIDACADTDQGEVRISTVHDQEQHRLCVVISDNGPGIPPDDQKRIFSLFESEKGNRGTGLGLPVSLKILQEHNGDIQVESETNKGSVFTLSWPAIPANTPPRPEHHTGVISVD